jgi:hypothetical protein
MIPLAASTKYTVVKGNADSIVYQMKSTDCNNPKYFFKTGSGTDTTFTTVDSLTIQIWGDTTGVQIRAHTHANSSQLAQGFLIDNYGWSSTRAVIQFLTRTGKEGTYRVYWKVY